MSGRVTLRELKRITLGKQQSRIKQLSIFCNSTELPEHVFVYIIAVYACCKNSVDVHSAGISSAKQAMIPAIITIVILVIVVEVLSYCTEPR